MKNKKLEVTGGFLLLVSLLFYFDRQNLLPWFFCAAAVHECGHWLGIRAAGGRIGKLRLTAVGAVISIKNSARMSYGGELAATLAGPVFNLLAALAFSKLGVYFGWDWAYLFAGLNFILAVFNLMPVRQLDGGRAVYLVVALFFSPAAAETVCRAGTSVVTALICMAGAYVFLVTGCNFTLLAVGVWLLLTNRREKSVVKKAKTV